MTDKELFQQALDALLAWKEEFSGYGWSTLDEETVIALSNRLAQPEPKPYDPMEHNVDYERGFVDGMQEQMRSSVDKAVNAISSKKPQQSWQGLTDEEIEDVFVSNEICDDWHDFQCIALLIDEKLREKNANQ